jgi:hypothetical protein
MQHLHTHTHTHNLNNFYRKVILPTITGLLLVCSISCSEDVNLDSNRQSSDIRSFTDADEFTSFVNQVSSEFNQDPSNSRLTYSIDDESIVPDFLQVVLDENNQVVIGNYQIQLDFEKESVYAVPVSNVNSKTGIVRSSEGVLTFTMNDDVLVELGLLESEELSGDQNARYMRCRGFGNLQHVRTRDFDAYVGGKEYSFHIKLQADYDRYGVYFRVFHEVLLYDYDDYDLDGNNLGLYFHKNYGHYEKKCGSIKSYSFRSGDSLNPNYLRLLARGSGSNIYYKWREQTYGEGKKCSEASGGMELDFRNHLDQSILGGYMNTTYFKSN